jgi:hypothetical protein
MKTGLKTKAASFLLMALSSALFAEGDISISHHVNAITGSDGKTSVSLGVTVLNSGSEAFEDASIRFKGPVAPTDISAATASLGALQSSDSTSAIMDFVVDGDAQMASLFAGELYFSFSGINENGETVTLNVNSAGGEL